MLQYINRARANPQAEMDALFNTNDPYIAAALDYFGTSESVAKSQVAGITSAAPVAWNTSLAQSAETHNDLMITYDQQSHNLPGEPNLLTRIDNAGFSLFAQGGTAGENVYAFSENILHSHAGFYIDWGDGPNGIQNPVGHRDVILSKTYTQVGVAVRSVPGGNTVGPLSVTQHFAYSPAESGPFILGVAINDIDNDDFYDIGEGLGGVRVTATGGGRTFTTTTWDSGGYSLKVASGSTYTVTFSGNGVDFSTNVTVGSENIAVDAERPSGNSSSGGNTGNTFDDPGPNASTTPSTGSDNIRGTSGSDNIESLGGNDLVKTGAGADTIDGGNGTDRLIAGRGDDNVYGGNGNDWLGGQKGNDALFGQSGNDTIRGAEGNDTIEGGSGNDRLRGHEGRDEVYGGTGDDLVFGGSGDDQVYGDAGNDRLKGGTGSDTMTGGSGSDKFHVEHDGASSNGDVDRITDFVFGTDMLIIESLNGARITHVQTLEDLQSLSLSGFSARQSGSDIELSFAEGAFAHTVILEDHSLIA